MVTRSTETPTDRKKTPTKSLETPTDRKKTPTFQCISFSALSAGSTETPLRFLLPCSDNIYPLGVRGPTVRLAIQGSSNQFTGTASVLVGAAGCVNTYVGSATIVDFKTANDYAGRTKLTYGTLALLQIPPSGLQKLKGKL